jgi:CIC family chloride channel protein
MFAIELMLPEVSVRTFLPVALATGTATFISRLFLGVRPAFDMPSGSLVATHPAPLAVLLLYAVLGAAAGLGATAFIRGLHAMEGTFERIGNAYLRHALGMLLVGVLMYALYRFTGQYYVDGVGYATIQDVLLGGLGAAPLLACLFFSKLAATTLSLGSGSSGGIFSPSLFMGATLGGAFGAVAHLIHPSPDINVAAFAIVGMAAMVGGGTGAAMTAVTMIFEMTRDYDIVMPLIIAVAVAIGVRRLLSRENIYTIKLVARGHFIPKALHANMFLVRRAGDVMDKDILILPAETSFDTFLKLPDHGGRMRHVVVTRGDEMIGVLRVNTGLRQGLEGSYTGVTLGEVAVRNFAFAREGDIMFDVIGRMSREKAVMVVVFQGAGFPRPSDITGLISRDQIADSVAESISPYAMEELGE